MAGYIDTSELVPQVASQGMPDNYQTEHATPDTFGANVGQALEHAGAEAAQTGSFYQQVAGDDATNKMLDLDSKIKYGDPNVQGDTGFMGLRGAQAMSALPGATKKLDDGLAAIRANLSSPFERLQFDQMSRRYRSFSMSAMGAHANQQQQEWAGQVNTASNDINLNAIAKASTDPNSAQLVPFYTDQLAESRVKAAMAKGAQPGDQVVQAAALSAHQDSLKAQVVALSATPAGAQQAQKLLDSNKDIAGVEYAPLMAHVRAQASQYTIDQGTADATHQAAAEAQGGGAPPPAGGAQDQAAGALRHYEGLETKAYWDVNHWRVGYGSDTITKADGTVEPVTQATSISPADAERDLQRRVVETQTKIVTQVSPQAWGALNKTQQAAVTSMGYNYGLLPQDVAFAIRGGGGPAAISAAILNHQNDNGGVNRQRRIDEARAVNGGSMPSGLPVTAPGLEGPQTPIGRVSPAFGAAMGEQPQPLPEAQPPGDQTQPIAGRSALQPAAYLVQETSPAGYRPLLGAQNAMSVAARAMQIWGARTDITPEQRETGFVRLRQNLQQAQFAAEATQQQIKNQSNNAAKGYIPRIVSGDATALADISKDPNLEFPTQMELLRMAQSRGIGTAGMGPAYNDALKRVALPFGDPNRISNYTQLLQMRNSGQLSDAGLSKAASDMEKIKAPDFQGVLTAKTATLDSVKNYMLYGDDAALLGGLKDPKGKAAYDKFVVAFEADFDQWTNSGKNPFDFLKDDKGIRALADSIRSPEQKRLDKITEQGGNSPLNAPITPETGASTPPPEGVEPQTWNLVLGAAPQIQGRQDGAHWPTSQWGDFVKGIVSSPPDVAAARIAAFNQRYPNVDLRGLVENLRPKQKAAPTVQQAVPQQPPIPLAPPDIVGP